MSLLLVRHGETALNVARVLQPADTPLGERGHRQAQALATRLAAGAWRIAGVVASDLPRAWQTAEPIARATGASLLGSPLWRERNFGAWRGRAYESFDFDPLSRNDAPPEGESLADFGTRVERAFADIVERHAALALAVDDALVVVTHGLVLRRLLERRLELPAALGPPFHVGNTGLTVVCAEPPYRASLVDCTRHLVDFASADDRGALSGG